MTAPDQAEQIRRALVHRAVRPASAFANANPVARSGAVGSVDVVQRTDPGVDQRLETRGQVNPGPRTPARPSEGQPDNHLSAPGAGALGSGFTGRPRQAPARGPGFLDSEFHPDAILESQHASADRLAATTEARSRALKSD
jgi:hypothetical protein